MPVAIKIKDLKVRSLDVDFLEVSWELEPTACDVLDFTFAVLRSESISGPFEALTPELEDRFIFVDNNIKVDHRYRQYHYKIRITERSSGDIEESATASQEPEPDLIALELRKHVNLLMREFAGRRCWVLPIRTFGQRCQCWDTTLHKRTKSRCLTCFDTGFVRGYMSPIEAWVQFDPSAKTDQVSNVGMLQQQNTTGRLGYWPAVKPRDLIIEPENRRWRVVQQSETQQGRARVHQEIQIHEIHKTDTEYKIPLILDDAIAYKDLFLTPARNFTNPHTLENFMDEELPKIYNLYPGTYPEVKT